MPPIVAPGTQLTRRRRKRRVRRGAGAKRLARALGVVRQGFGAAQLAAQRRLVVLGRQHVAGGNMMQLNPPARPTQRLRRRERVQGERLGGSRIVIGERTAAGLVVDDNKLTVTIVEPVDPPGQRQPFGACGYLAFHRHRFGGRIKPSHIALHHLRCPLPPAKRLIDVPPAVQQPPEADEMRGASWGTARQRLVPPGPQGLVHAGTHRVVSPRRALRRCRAVQVCHPVPARAVGKGGKLRRRAHEKSPRHAVQLQLVHDMILSLGRWHTAAATSTQW